MQLAFLGSVEALQTESRSAALDTSNWANSWVVDASAPDAELNSPVGVEISLQLQGWGEMRRLYALLPL